jgi:hypothetical protein
LITAILELLVIILRLLLGILLLIGLLLLIVLRWWRRKIAARSLNLLGLHRHSTAKHVIVILKIIEISV